MIRQISMWMPVVFTLATAGCAKNDDAAKEGESDKPAGDAAAAKPDTPAQPDAAPRPAAAANKCGDQPCPCEEGSKNRPDDAWTICKLSADTEIQGHSCAKGRVLFHDGGELEECELTAVETVGLYKCKSTPRRTSFYPDGKLRECAAAEDVEIGGFPIKANKKISLFDDGTLKAARLEEPREIDGVPCKSSVRWFQSRKLRACTLAAEHELEGNKLPAGTQVVWFEDGKLRGLGSEKPLEWDGKTYDQKKTNKRGGWLCFKEGKPDPQGFGCNSF